MIDTKFRLFRVQEELNAGDGICIDSA
jgi:hypothetical protein